jgi:hypothetical protein
VLPVIGEVGKNRFQVPFLFVGQPSFTRQALHNGGGAVDLARQLGGLVRNLGRVVASDPRHETVDGSMSSVDVGQGLVSFLEDPEARAEDLPHRDLVGAQRPVDHDSEEEQEQKSQTGSQENTLVELQNILPFPGWGQTAQAAGPIACRSPRRPPSTRPAHNRWTSAAPSSSWDP